jgi:hypothetical protein
MKWKMYEKNGKKTYGSTHNICHGYSRYCDRGCV